MTALREVVGTNSALASILGKAAFGGPFVHGHHGIGRKGAEAHGRNIKNAKIVGLTTVWSTYRNLWILFNTIKGKGVSRMRHPFIAFIIDIELGTKRNCFLGFFGPLINEGALAAAKRRMVQIRLNKILADSGTQAL